MNNQYTLEFLKDKVNSKIIEIIKSHNYEYLGTAIKKKESFALIASDTISGLIISTALVIKET